MSFPTNSFYGFFPMRHGRTRIIGLLPEGTAQETASFEAVQPVLEAEERMKVHDVSWFSAYRVHHRVAEHFQQGRAFLVGDAGHVHSPVGGQGMNTGLGDAANLGWKLEAVLRGTAPAELLATYEAERLPFAHQLVNTTDRGFTVATRPAPWPRLLRNQVAPLLAPLALRLGQVRRLLFRTVSQIGISYPDSPLSQGDANGVTGGMRLPWAAGRYDALRPVGWQVLSVGLASAALRAWAQRQRVPMTEVPPAARETPGTTYLVRPDGYIWLVVNGFSEMEFKDYAERWLGKSGY